jgi:hypothetical protein
MIAVVYESYIMIMFGFDSEMKLQQDFNGLDASDVNHITWARSTPSTNHTTGNSNSNNGNGGLSLGGTIGVAIAAAAVFVRITLISTSNIRSHQFFFFFLSSRLV